MESFERAGHFDGVISDTPGGGHAQVGERTTVHVGQEAVLALARERAVAVHTVRGGGVALGCRAFVDI